MSNHAHTLFSIYADISQQKFPEVELLAQNRHLQFCYLMLNCPFHITLKRKQTQYEQLNVTIQVILGGGDHICSMVEQMKGTTMPFQAFPVYRTMIGPKY